MHCGSRRLAQALGRMSKLIRVLIGIFAAIGAAQVAMLTLFFFSTRSESGCIGGEVMEVTSPTRAYVAEVRTDTCSPSHELRTVVWLSAYGTSTSVFMAPSTIQDAGTYSPLSLHITWLNDTELQIAYPRGTQLQSHPDLIQGVKVVYKEFTSYAP